jgi:hypothetical protein
MNNEQLLEDQVCYDDSDQKIYHNNYYYFHGISKANSSLREMIFKKGLQETTNIY